MRHRRLVFLALPFLVAFCAQPVAAQELVADAAAVAANVLDRMDSHTDSRDPGSWMMYLIGVGFLANIATTMLTAHRSSNRGERMDDRLAESYQQQLTLLLEGQKTAEKAHAEERRADVAITAARLEAEQRYKDGINAKLEECQLKLSQCHERDSQKEVTTSQQASELNTQRQEINWLRKQITKPDGDVTEFQERRS